MATKIYKNIKRVSDLSLSSQALSEMLAILAHRNSNYSQPLSGITQKKIKNVSQLLNDNSGSSVPISLLFRDDSIMRLALKNGSFGPRGEKGKTGEQGDKGGNAEINTERSKNWLVIANDLATNDSSKALSALQGLDVFGRIEDLSETYMSEYQYSLLYVDHVTIEAEFETFEDMQVVQLIANDSDSHKRYVKYWTYEAEGEEEYFVLNHFSSTEENKVYDSIYCDLWEDIYLGGREGYFEATSNQLTDGSPLFILDKSSNEYVRIEQYDPESENGLEFGERAFIYYLPNTKMDVNAKYAPNSGYDYSLKATELELNAYVMGEIVDGSPTYNKVTKDEIDPNSLTVYYQKLEDGTFEAISDISQVIAKKALRFYAKLASGWAEVESIDEIDVEGFEEYASVEYTSSSNTNIFTRYTPAETNRGVKYYKVSTDILNNYSITYYIYDADRQYFTRRITTVEDEAGNVSFNYEYTKITIPFWLEAEFITEEEDSNVRLITNQIYATEGDVEYVTPIYISSIEFEESEIEIAKNFNKDIKVNISPANANQTNLVIEYDENVVEFYEDGRIAAIESNETTKETTIKVWYENDPSIFDVLKLKIVTPVESINVAESSINIYPGNTYQIEWQLNPEEVSNDGVSFSVSDESLLSVTPEGLASPKRNADGTTNTGNCIITMTANDGYGATAQIAALIANPATGLLIKSSPKAFVGRNYQLETEIIPESATEKSLDYESSDPDVISISNYGACTPKSVGTCTLYAKTKDGSNIVASQEVNVTIGVSEIKFINFDIDSLDAGLSKEIQFEILPENAHNKAFDFWVSDISQLSFTTPELVEGFTNRYSTTLTALSSGNPQIAIEALDGTGVIASKDLQITVPMNDISLSQSSLTMYVGDDFTVLRTIFNNNEEQPSNASITWHTSDASVASVDGQGRVTPVGAGRCIISAISNDGNGVIASCNVVVKVKVESIELNDGDESGIQVIVGNYEFIKAKVSPDYATDQILKWTSDTPEICSVEDNGTVFGKSIGTATITATSYDLNATKSIQVAVVEKIENN